MGLNYKEFQQALLRIAIKHKSIFNKIADNIKEGINKEPIEEVANYEKDEN